ncbi:hypothetical protein FACS1894177_06480 [Bacteroidia bacterium]|nr:hypothetical protein FACS1894177_06480 [Bacteroidia bacterium]
MAYSKRNLLLKIIEIQNIVIREKKRGVSQKWVYNNLIKKRYFIEYSTFNSYMGRNAKKELADLNANESQDKRQLNLFD